MPGAGEMALQDWLGLVMVVLVLGIKHGMDPDHLATIDGLTRFHAHNRPRLARWSGCLFTLGHGLVVTLAAGLSAVIMSESSPPAWLERLGAWISILFLLALGSANLAAVFWTPNSQVVRPSGLKARWLGRLVETRHPMVIASIGAVFALSIDTWSQAALFSLTAMHLAGWAFSVVLGLVFMVGMMVADGLNGIWVARMLRRADRQAVIASRIMSLVIGLLSVSIAVLGVARYLLPEVAATTENAGLMLGLGVVALLLASYAVSVRLSGQQEVAR